MFFFNYFRVISYYIKVFKKLNLFLHSVCKFYNKWLFLQFPLSWILSFSFQPKCENKLGQCEAGNSWINAHMGKSALLILSEMRETWEHHREKFPTVFRKQEVIWSSTQPSLCCPQATQFRLSTRTCQLTWRITSRSNFSSFCLFDWCFWSISFWHHFWSLVCKIVRSTKRWFSTWIFPFKSSKFSQSNAIEVAFDDQKMILFYKKKNYKTEKIKTVQQKQRKLSSVLVSWPTVIGFHSRNTSMLRSRLIIFLFSDVPMTLVS